jgi:hypothetical protein
MKDTLNAEDFRLSPEDLAQNNGQHKPARMPRAKAKRLIGFYQFPRMVVDELIRADSAPAWALAAIIYETWYYDYEKRNPVRLTTQSVRNRGISRASKLRALKILENTGQFVVERTPGQNPMVTMKWMLIKD